MTMNKIGGSDIVRSRILDQFQRSDGADGRTSAQVNQDRSGAARELPTADRLELSDRARRLEGAKRVYDAGLSALEEIGDVRRERIAQARARLDSGYYDSTEVRQEVAAKLGAAIKRLDAILS